MVSSVCGIGPMGRLIGEVIAASPESEPLLSSCAAAALASLSCRLALLSRPYIHRRVSQCCSQLEAQAEMRPAVAIAAVVRGMLDVSPFPRQGTSVPARRATLRGLRGFQVRPAVVSPTAPSDLVILVPACKVHAPSPSSLTAQTPSINHQRHHVYHT